MTLGRPRCHSLGDDSGGSRRSPSSNNRFQIALVGMGVVLLLGGLLATVVGVPVGGGPGAPAAGSGNLSDREQTTRTTVQDRAAGRTPTAAADETRTPSAAEGTASTAARRTETAGGAATTSGPPAATTSAGTSTAGGGANATVVYRVNVGGPRLPSSDSGPPWTGDTPRMPSRYGNAQESVSYSGNTTDAVSTTGAVPPGTPARLFRSWRWDRDLPGNASDDVEMQWSFPVEAGARYEVRLYFAENYFTEGEPRPYEEGGPRRFDVDVEGNQVLQAYDIFADVGHGTGTVKSTTVTVQDDTLEIHFRHVAEDPMLNGIEILRVPADGAGDRTGGDDSAGEGDSSDGGDGRGNDADDRSDDGDSNGGEESREAAGAALAASGSPASTGVAGPGSA